MAAPPRKKQPQKQGRKRMSARIVEDEDYQLRHEKVAGIDIAKASGMICLRLPPEDEAGRRRSKVWEAGSTVPEIEAVAEELLAAGVELVSMESTSDYWRSWFSALEEAGLRVQLVNASGPQPAGPAENRQGRRAVDRAADRDGAAPPELRAAAGDPGAEPKKPASRGDADTTDCYLRTALLPAAGKSAGHAPKPRRLPQERQVLGVLRSLSTPSALSRGVDGEHGTWCHGE